MRGLRQRLHLRLQSKAARASSLVEGKKLAKNKNNFEKSAIISQISLAFLPKVPLDIQELTNTRGGHAQSLVDQRILSKYLCNYSMQDRDYNIPTVALNINNIPKKQWHLRAPALIWPRHFYYWYFQCVYPAGSLCC